jgi:hypothetical protein
LQLPVATEGAATAFDKQPNAISFFELKFDLCNGDKEMPQRSASHVMHA